MLNNFVVSTGAKRSGETCVLPGSTNMHSPASVSRQTQNRCRLRELSERKPLLDTPRIIGIRFSYQEAQG